jgi:hypothetical protein
MTEDAITRLLLGAAALTASGVSCLLVGSAALRLHGARVDVHDTDVVIEPAEQNLRSQPDRPGAGPKVTHPERSQPPRGCVPASRGTTLPSESEASKPSAGKIECLCAKRPTGRGRTTHKRPAAPDAGAHPDQDV